MIIKVDDILLFELTALQEKVIKNDIESELFDADMKRRVQYSLEDKYEQCFRRLRKEWEPKLEAKGVTSIPTDDIEFTNLVFAQPEYKDKSARILEAKEQGL